MTTTHLFEWSHLVDSTKNYQNKGKAFVRK